MALEGEPLRMTLLYADPVVRLLENFVLDAEIEEILSLHEGSLRRSHVLASDGGNEFSEVRTSWTAYLPAGQGSDAVARVEQRAVAVSGHPLCCLETLQLVRYQPGQRYEPHFDYFTHEGLDSQRTTTIFAYLNDADVEACTEFPQLGLCVPPRKGCAVMWENVLADGLELRVDPRLKHGGRAPSRGVKYGLNIWFRSTPQR